MSPNPSQMDEIRSASAIVSRDSRVKTRHDRWIIRSVASCGARHKFLFAASGEGGEESAGIAGLNRFSQLCGSVEGGGVAFPPRSKPGAWKRRFAAHSPVEGWGWGRVPSVCVSANVERKRSLSCMIWPAGRGSRGALNRRANEEGGRLNWGLIQRPNVQIGQQRMARAHVSLLFSCSASPLPERRVPLVPGCC